MRTLAFSLRSSVVLLLAFAFTFSALCSPRTAHGQRTISLSSGSFSFEVEPGESGEGEVVVINDGDEPLKALVYMTDVQIDDTGAESFVEPRRDGASLLTTPASWFRVFMPADSKSVGNTPYLELEPGERVPIRFSFTPPNGTPSGDHNVVLFFEMFELISGDEGAAAQVSGRLGSRIALRVSGEVIEDLTLRPFEVPAVHVGAEVPFRFIVNNGGNTNKRVNVVASLLDRSERAIVSSVVASSTAVLANARYEFMGALKTGAAQIGPHAVEVRVEYLLEGASQTTELVETRTVWLIPLWMVALVGAVVASVIAYAVSRFVTRRRARAQPPQDGSTLPSHSERPADSSGEDRADTQRPSSRVAPAPSAPAAYSAVPAPRISRHSGRMSRKQRKAEEDERRRRREERAAETARPTERYGRGIEEQSPGDGTS